MTVSTAVNETNVTVAAAIGSTANIPFMYLALGDVRVIDNGTLKTLSTDYTLTAAGVTTGGTLTTVTAFSAVSLATRIIRSVAKTQLTDYQETGSFSAESHEDALDRGIMISQAALSRDTTNATTWDAESDRIVNVTNPTSAQDAATKTYADNLVISSGNVPAPTALDSTEERHLKATAANTFTWELTDEAPEPTSGQVTDKAKTVLRPNTATEGTHSEWDLSNENPAPTSQQVTDTLKTTLRPNTTTDGDYSVWATTDEIPIPSGTQITRKSRTVVQANLGTIGNHGVLFELTTPSQNFLYNGDFAVAQKGTSFTSATTPANSDDVWLLDRWLLLSDGNDTVDVSQDTAVRPSGAFASIKLEVETNNRKFGIVQILEERDTRTILRDGATTRVSLSFEARTTATFVIENIRAGVAAWTSAGVADSVTSDIVSAWGAEGTNPTLATNWAFENTPANLVLTNSFSRFTINNILLDQTALNLAVFIWVDDTDAAVNDLLYISKVKLERGDIDTPYQGIRFADDLAACQRYWCQSFDQGTAPASTTQVGAIHFTSSATQIDQHAAYPVTMRILPHTLAVYNTNNSSTPQIRDLAGGGANRVAQIQDVGDMGFHVFATSSVVDGREHVFHFTADAEL